MSRALPVKEEYYRPQCAAELRRRSAWWDRLRQQSPCWWGWAWVLALASSYCWHTEVPFLVLLATWVFGSTPLDHSLLGWAQRLRAVADALETEHQGLYGSETTPEEQ